MSGRCEFYADALIERAAGALDGERAARLDAHLAVCPDCTASLATIRALQAAPLSVPAGLEGRIRAAVREAGASGVSSPVRPAAAPAPERHGRPRWRIWAAPLAAAAALAALWIGIGLPGRSDPAAEAVAVFDDYDPYGVWPADGLIVAGEPVLSELSVEELEWLLLELES
jgi:anti-sigma factor RsiW